MFARKNILKISVSQLLLLSYSLLVILFAVLSISLTSGANTASAYNVCPQFRCNTTGLTYEGDCDYRVGSCDFRMNSVCGAGNWTIVGSVNDTRRWCESEGLIQPEGDAGTKSQGEVCNIGQCQPGLVCTPDPDNHSISRCYPVVGDNDSRCPDGGTCTGFISFRCNQLDSSGVCMENPVDGFDLAHVNGCGQIDMVCEGGSKHRQLCGDAVIYSNSCGTTPPIEDQPVACNQACSGFGQGNCTDGLTCTQVGTQNLCRLSTNPTSETCQPPERPRVCNEECSGVGVGNCESNLSCINVNGQNRCRLTVNPASEVCQPITANANFSIDKTLIGGGTYLIGDIATFIVTIRNTGNTTFTNISFRDQFDSTILRYTSGSVSRLNAQGEVVANVSDLNTIVNHSNGRFSIPNLAGTSLGVLAPGQSYQFNIRFTVNAPSANAASCNTAFAQPTGLEERSDNACLNTRNRDTDI